jgi:4-oxalomesaconate hydratase
MATPPPTLLYIGAHDVDFLVRAGGTLAKYARRGSRVVSVSLTYGERSESARLWRERPGITLEEVKSVRRQESERCAAVIGRELRILDWGDGPIVFDRERYLALAKLIQEFRPQVLITHWPNEITNPDHLNTAAAVKLSAAYAAAPGTAYETGSEPWAVGATYFSEPTFPFPDRNAFNPNIWVDITDAYEQKLEGLRAAWSHGLLDVTYPLCATFRGTQAQLYSRNPAITYAEAYLCEKPWVGDRLPFEG